MSSAYRLVWIYKYFLLCLLCFNSAFLATIETAFKPDDDEDEDILHLDFFRFTTTKRHTREDWIVPTSVRLDKLEVPPYSGESSSPFIIFLYVFIPIFIIAFLATLTYHFIRISKEGNCCCFKSDSQSSMSADLFIAVHPPPPITAAQVHGPLTGRNQFPDSRIGAPAYRGLFSEFDSNRAITDNTGGTASFINYTYASSFQDRRIISNTVVDRPPDYSTVAMDDLFHLTQPTCPSLQKDIEPPPEYAEEDPFFK